MKIVEYDNKYLPGIISCFKRNFKDMEGIDDKAIEEWMRPLVSYSWKDASNEQQRYKYGMVLLNNDTVVGYCGLIFSNILIDGINYKCVNPSTWAIDHEFSFNVFQVMNEMIDNADIVLDYTPIENVLKMCLEMYDFKYLDKEKYKFIPIPCFSRKLDKCIIRYADEIDDVDVKKEYLEHIKYGVKCAKFKIKNEKAYIFYKRIFSEIKGIKRIPFTLILDVKNKDIIISNIHEIVWFLQRKEAPFIEIEGRFLDHSSKIGGMKIITNNKRLVFSEKIELSTDDMDLDITNNEKLTEIGLLYSEIAMLGQIRYFKGEN